MSGLFPDSDIMDLKWNFPSNNYGTVTGIGEAGIETFKGSPYKSLAREICQNSMDARLDLNEPVKIEFSLYNLDKRKIYDYKTLEGAMQSCYDFWKETKKTANFFKNAISVIEKEAIPVLRISDFNTTGLTGSDKEYNTPWQNLVKASGVSDKSETSGGSFGIGKAAPFACSNLRTVFYATKDIDGLSASQGIARLVSFKEKGLFGKEKDSITSGTGFCSVNNKNAAASECISLDPDFKRVNTGTDVYILGFTAENTWKRDIISSIIEDFLVAIFNNELVVVVDGTEISKNTLSDIFEEYKDIASTGYNYYKVLTDDRTQYIEHCFEGLGTIGFYILLERDFHRRVMMCRKNGMKIFDQKNISSSIQFAGVCVLLDDSINSYFREMENPQHNAWEPERHSKKTEANKNRKMLAKYIKDTVISIGKNTTVDEVDAEGVGEYIADLDLNDTTNQEKAETITDKTKDIEINVVEVVKTSKGFEKATEGNDKNSDDYSYEFETGDSGAKNTHDDAPNQSHNGTGFGSGEGDNPGTNSVGDNSYSSPSGNITGYENNSINENDKFRISTMSVRVFLSDKSKCEYTLIFVPQKTAGKGYIQLKMSGEQKSEDVAVRKAHDPATGQELVCSDNKIYIESINTGQKSKVKFELKYMEECSLEVVLYGYSK